MTQFYQNEKCSMSSTQVVENSFQLVFINEFLIFSPLLVTFGRSLELQKQPSRRLCSLLREAFIYVKQIVISEIITKGDNWHHEEGRDKIETKMMKRWHWVSLMLRKELAIWIWFRDPICSLKRIFHCA